jgi:DNA-binding NarL/FixJ family response regulator
VDRGSYRILLTCVWLPSKLSKREQEILKLIALGKSNKEIASDLFIAEDTVKTHRKKLKVKLCVDNQYDMVRYAQSFNLI